MRLDVLIHHLCGLLLAVLTLTTISLGAAVFMEKENIFVFIVFSLIAAHLGNQLYTLLKVTCEEDEDAA